MVQGEGFVFVGAFLWKRAGDPRLRFSTGSGYVCICGLWTVGSGFVRLCLWAYGLIGIQAREGFRV